MPKSGSGAQGSGRSPADGALAIVVIGRNEGTRLERSLRAAQGCADALVYVDSASSDASVERARSQVDRVVTLDGQTPLSAARARNAGFAAAQELLPNLALVQFVDGDCALEESWLSLARTHLETHPELGGVCGRRREWQPESSFWSRLLDFEWNAPIGPVETFAGDVLVQTGAFLEAGGYDETLVAGEDPDFAARLRRAGWVLERIPAEMSSHDATGLRAGQWWARQIRAGYALAEAWRRKGYALRVSEARRAGSAVFWGGLVPVCTAAAITSVGVVGVWGVALYAALIGRIFVRERQRRSSGDSALWAASCTLAKFPTLHGMALHLWRRLRSPANGLIEYK